MKIIIFRWCYFRRTGYRITNIVMAMAKNSCKHTYVGIWTFWYRSLRSTVFSKRLWSDCRDFRQRWITRANLNYKDGIICKYSDIDDYKKAIDFICNLSYNDNKKIRTEAYNSMIKKYDPYSNFIHLIRDLLNKLHINE